MPPKPLEATVIDEAVAWLSHFWSGEANEASRAEWQRWRAADPAHERAWQHIEAMDSRWAAGAQNLTATTALQALSAARPDRRQALKALSLMTLVAGSGWLAQSQLPWPVWVADARTATGESQSMVLADGSTVTLNTQSAMNLTVNDKERRVTLVRGEIFVAAAADSATTQRPFVVQSALGNLYSHGAEYLVHQRQADVRVSVLKGSVLVHPKHLPDPPLPLLAGQSVTFAEGRMAAVQPLGHQAAWLDGVLVASNTSLAAFLGDLSRYYPGRIGCDPVLADLRLSGTFPLTQVQRIPNALTQILPVQVQTFGPWVTRLVPAEKPTA